MYVLDVPFHFFPRFFGGVDDDAVSFLDIQIFVSVEK